MKSKIISERIHEAFNINENSVSIDDIESAIRGVKNLMQVGDELKKLGVKYDFSSNPAPMPPVMYTFKLGSDKYAILNKKYVSGADFIHGEIAMGKL